MKKLKTRKLKKQNNIALLIILIFLLFFGAGFAYVQSVLSIRGNSTISKISSGFKLRFEDLKIIDGSVTAITPPVIDEKKPTELSFSVPLNKMGDFYEFEVDIVNGDEVDVMLSESILECTASDLMKYLDYSVTYIDGSELEKGNLLKVNERERIKVRIAYTEAASKALEFLEEKTISFSYGVVYEQDFGEGVTRPISNKMYLANKILDDNTVVISSSPARASISLEKSKNKIHLFQNVVNGSYPIYYYQGDVENNNVIFADYCWKIIRTTETGGIKLIFNGTPNGNICNNMGESTQVAVSAFNSGTNSIAYLGYMYGTIYATQSRNKPTSAYYYAQNVSYVSSSSRYNLTTRASLKMSTSTVYDKHYTCFKSGTYCSTSVNYVYYIDSTTAYYLNLTSGNTFSDALNAMKTNTTESVIKGVLDGWYQENLAGTNYENALEDTVFCNNRTTYGGALYSISAYYTYLNTLGNYNVPTFTCSNATDKFTTTSSNGNGKLTYPIGLITADEVRFAGGSPVNDNGSYYLNSGINYWTMSPSSVSSSIYMSAVNDKGKLVEYTPNTSTIGVRPVISLKPDIKIKKGNGQKDYPYIIEIN